MKNLKESKEKIEHQRLIKLLEKAEREAVKFLQKNERLEEDIQNFRVASSQQQLNP